MFCYIVDTIIQQIDFFATCLSIYIYDRNNIFVYFYFIYPIQDLGG